MGKYGSPQVGLFAKSNEDYDRPDLNKCPDCDVYFSSDICPVCKKVCPEEMRAGNRETKTIRKNKSSKLKKTIISVFFAVSALIVFSVILFGAACEWISRENESLNSVSQTTKFSKDDYNSEIGYEELYRYPEKYKGEKVKISGLVYVAVDGDSNAAIITDQSGLLNWFCVTYTSNESEARLMSGDIVTVYGKGNGLFDFDWMSVPWISADLIELEPTSAEDIRKDTPSQDMTPKMEPEIIEFEFGEEIEIGNWKVNVTEYAITNFGKEGTAFSDTNSISLYVKIKNTGSEKRAICEDMFFSLVYDGKYTYTPDYTFGINDAVPVMGNDNGYFYFYIPKEICESDMRVEVVITAKNAENNPAMYMAKSPAK